MSHLVIKPGGTQFRRERSGQEAVVQPVSVIPIWAVPAVLASIAVDRTETIHPTQFEKVLKLRRVEKFLVLRVSIQTRIEIPENDRAVSTMPLGKSA